MRETIQRALSHVNDTSPITSMRSLSGGDINQAFYVETLNEQYFIKGNQHISSHFFRVEAEGLNLIKESDTLSVPNVHYYDEPEDGSPAVIVMDWITQTPSPKSEEQLGRLLAEMHATHANQFGFHEETFVGTLPQPNGWFDNWLVYYRDQRLKNQFERAVQQNKMPASRHRKMETLLTYLERWIPARPSPSLLHGDLWGGNWMSGPEGRPYVIDPSILYGDRAFELAFTELFGGFPKTFYSAYEEVQPLPDYYHDTKPLYQLFYLLVHLNIFGESYGPSVDRVLDRYVT
ncbi:fructosamine kinase family protein [Thalassobacillus sp. CUG 92003]|uniref:fructosamine kinase family protein n=1 Tax=Thalassobacillus sp. CUG 92003 TaxID=2736641 RepID=UPI0015E71D8A|nr:fructosamine kinase family protein [Thalassobacillus sp. CUG 92003]